MTTEKECIETLREAASTLGESPTKAAYEELGLRPASATIIRTMGGWNDAKEAAGLETNPSSGTRVGSKPDDLPDDVDEAWESLSVDQRWHYRNREWNTERTLERRASLRRWIHEMKRGSDGCDRCDVSSPLCLDFHHREEHEKEMAVNKMVPSGYSKADIRAEIEKCVLLCANCHAREHTAAIDPSAEQRTKEERLRAWTRAYKRERGCSRCHENDPRCLQFHHVEEKTLGVGAMIANSYAESAVRDEVEKCEILCANCHRQEHLDAPTDGGENDRI
ncbi:homing endonuclease associated repeat-containing protein [Haloarchaeobius sp. HRN-SO-5]|uniref:homing endonuclease associated repeat-containing protein n=1 Tax=Haloarchaeobius sp. HRN-SO-5 TaxID=3446118 RepID=UPI003EBC87B7